MLLDLLQSFPLAMFRSHPEAALESCQSRDGHVHAHGVQEPHSRALKHSGLQARHLGADALGYASLTDLSGSERSQQGE